MKKKLFYFLFCIIFLLVLLYFCIGFYIAHTILRMDHSCGAHEGSLPNNWSTKIDHDQYKNFFMRELRKDFPSSDYYLSSWEEVDFQSREKDVNISGWLFNYFSDKPIVIVVHGIFPNGKCKPESNLIAGLLIKNNINALTIDLRNYGDSSKKSNYENLGLTAYKDVLGAYDFLQTIGFKKNEIGLLGISLGATSVIFAAEKEANIKAIWSDSSIAEFKMSLKDEISRYGFSHDFGYAVSLAGQTLTGIDPTKLNPALSLIKKKNYFFTHGKKDERVLVKHFEFFKKQVALNNIQAEFWLVPDAYHVDAMLMDPELYGKKMKSFFINNLK